MTENANGAVPTVDVEAHLEDYRSGALPGALPLHDEPHESWKDGLRYQPRGGLVSCLPNAITLFGHDPAWRDGAGSLLAFDDLAQAIVTTRPPPWTSDDAPASSDAGELADVDTVRAQAWLERVHLVKLRREAVHDALSVVAHRRRVHPIRDWLDGLHWDGVVRLGAWLSTYLGAEPSPVNAVVGRLFLTSAVARVYRPGCKVDTMMVLEGPQGARKSTALRVLFGERWFSDTPLDLESKDRFVGLRGRWCLEMAELDSLSRAGVERIKSFLSSPIDTYRPPYGRGLANVPRGCVFAGSTNGEAYLKDDTGNRRFWPVAVGRIDADGLARVRELLWAEAREAFACGAPWWPTDAEQGMLGSEQAQRLVEDAWQPIVDRYLATRLPDVLVTVGDVLGVALGLEKGRWGQNETNRAARCLRLAGWRRVQRRVEGARAWGYVSPLSEAEPPATRPYVAKGPVTPVTNGQVSPVSPVSEAEW